MAPAWAAPAAVECFIMARKRLHGEALAADGAR